MSRSAASLLRSAPTAAQPAARVSFRAASGVLSSSSRKSPFHTSPTTLARSTTNTISVDPRILDGTAGFLPRENVDRLIEWQTGLWERLAAEVRNNPGLHSVKQTWDESGLDMTKLLTETARDPSLALAFNYASALINNSYFLESINPSDPQQLPSFAEASAGALQEKVEAYAEGIMGGGWLWLVRTGVNHQDMDIVPTFGAGTLLVTQRAQQGREAVPLFGTPSSSSSSPSASTPSPTTSATEPTSTPAATKTPPPNQASVDAKQRLYSQEQNTAKHTLLPRPLAVLNLHEMAYLGSKYGVWDRKKYAGDWFRSLDWARVAERTRMT